MSREQLHDALGFNFWFMSGQFGVARLEEGTGYTLDSDSHLSQYVESVAPGTWVRLPPTTEGKFVVITNTGTEDLDVQSANGVSLFTLAPGACNLFHTEGVDWFRLVTAGVTYDVFNGEGPGSSTGLVPDPGAAQAELRFLGSDAAWHLISASGIADGFAFITDGTNTAAASGADTFKVRSSSGKISAVVTNNEAVHGDNVNLSVVEGSVDHDALLNFVANEHIDHTSVSISTGSGLTGGGDISTTRTINFNFQGLTAISGAPVAADIIPVRQISTASHRRTTLGDISVAIDHDATVNFVADEHVAHSGVSINTGTGLTGGGNITASRTINLDFSALPTQAEAMASGDTFPFHDLSGGIHKKVSWGTINTSLDHDALANFVANEHIDHTAVTITGTGNLTGGGTIAANRTLDMANMNQATVKGRAAGAGSGTPTDLTQTQLTALINNFTAALSGAVPLSGGGTANFLRADASWQPPPNTLGSDGDKGDITVGGTGTTLTIDNGVVSGAKATANFSTVALTWVIDGGGSPITTGVKRGIYVPFACTLTSWAIILDQSGSIVIDVWMDTLANHPPDVADTITAAAKPTVSGAVQASSSSLTGWTTAVPAGRVLYFNVDSIATATWAEITLVATKT